MSELRFDAADWIYFGNLLLGIIGFSWLLLRTSHRFGEVPKEVQWLLYVTLVFILALLNVSYGQLSEHRPINLVDFPHRAFNWDPFLIGAAKIGLLTYLYATRNALYRTGTRSPGGSDPQTPGTADDDDDPNRDVQA